MTQNVNIPETEKTQKYQAHGPKMVSQYLSLVLCAVNSVLHATGLGVLVS